MDTDLPPKSFSSTYVFGPVLSRRLGRSLGIDLVPFKTCAYNCIYCQLGRTTNQTLERKAYVPADRVIEELKEKLSSFSSPPDYITFSGSGEPTLNSEIDWLIEEINHITNIPIAVLTNGSLLHLEEVRKALMGADVVIPSLDAASLQLFKFINRPHPSLHFSQIVRGLKEFRKEYAGQVWLEIMLCGGINDEPKEIKRLRDEIEKIGPDRIQLNTVIRPPAEEFAYPLSPARMEEIRLLFSGRAEVVPRECSAPASRAYGQIDQEILALLDRRPCSLEDLSRAFGVSEEEMGKCLQEFRKNGAVRYDIHNHTVFYKARKMDQKGLTLAR